MLTDDRIGRKRWPPCPCDCLLMFFSWFEGLRLRLWLLYRPCPHPACVPSCQRLGVSFPRRSRQARQPAGACVSRCIDFCLVVAVPVLVSEGRRRRGGRVALCRCRFAQIGGRRRNPVRRTGSIAFLLVAKEERMAASSAPAALPSTSQSWCGVGCGGLRKCDGVRVMNRSQREWSVSSSRPGLMRIECKESRIGKAPVEVPSSVTINLQGQKLEVKGPLGDLALTYPREVVLSRDETGKIIVTRALETRRARQMHGLYRTLTDNMVVGVSTGYSKRLQLIGVGYRATVEGRTLVMNVGFSHPVRVAIPDGITAKVDELTKLIVSGRDKCAVGDFAAAVRNWRRPEPYKGKGIKYSDEVIRRKEGKMGKKK